MNGKWQTILKCLSINGSLIVKVCLLVLMTPLQLLAAAVTQVTSKENKSVSQSFCRSIAQYILGVLLLELIYIFFE